MSDNTFVLAADGWAQVTPCGEFPHAGAGVVQVIDRVACDAMAAEFNARKADANFPGVLVDFDHFDPKSRRFTLHKNPAFVSAVEERLKAKGLDKTADVVLICRSGDRTTRAVNALAAAGFTRVWTVIDGFEGDTASAGADRGKRTVNGWKNAGLPWSYALESSQVWLPAGAR